MKPKPTGASTEDRAYAEFGRGRFDVVSGSKLAHIMAIAGKSILDVGCGPGAYVRALRERGYTVDGVDSNPMFVAEARKSNARIYEADLDVEGLRPVADGSYDTVMALDVLEHVKAPSALLSEMVRVCRRNIVVTVPAEAPSGLTQAGLLYGSYLDPTHRRYYTPSGLRELLLDARLHGVTVVATWTLQPLMTHLFPSSLKSILAIANRLLVRLVTPESNWAVLLGYGVKESE